MIEFHRVNLRGYTAHPMAFSTENELEEPHPFRHKRAQTKLARGQKMRTQTDSTTIVAQKRSAGGALELTLSAYSILAH